jgi:hypothetical protein
MFPLPKVMRVMSGEKVVVSDLLAQSRDSTLPSVGTTSSPVAGQPNATRGSVHLGKNDPIPKGIERNLMGVNELILEVRNELYVCLQCALRSRYCLWTRFNLILSSTLGACRVEGRTPYLQEWQRLITNVDELHDDLGRLVFDWTEEDEGGR